MNGILEELFPTETIFMTFLLSLFILTVLHSYNQLNLAEDCWKNFLYHYIESLAAITPFQDRKNYC